MCTNFVFVSTSGSYDLARRLGVPHEDFVFSDNHRPGSAISMILGEGENRRIITATWWLYLQQTATGLTPHRDYFSVNTNYKKLASKPEYRTARCVIPASAYAESQSGKSPHLLKPADASVITFGGLYKQWVDKSTGEMVYSSSIITLRGHPKLTHIHKKSIPLWVSDSLLEAWLDPQVTTTDLFDALLEPAIRTPLKITPIDKIYRKNPIGESHIVQGEGASI